MTYIIAEIGINHNGDLDTAKNLIEMAADSGCNAVKFQKRNPDMCVPEHQKSVIRETPWGSMTYLEYKHKIEFGKDEFDEVDIYCKQKGIDWFASAWDLESQKFLQQYNLKYNKIASAMLTYDDLLEEVAKERRHTFVSTGMSTLTQIAAAVDIFRKHKCPFTVMACTSTYPCDISECNVRFVQTLREKFPDSIGIGYSGHEKGILPTTLAVALGATVVERHITLDRTMWGSDHAASLGPHGLRLLCRDIGHVSEMLGDGKKRVYKSEEPILQKLRKF